MSSNNEIALANKVNQMLERPTIVDLALRKLKEGYKPLSVARQIQTQLLEFTDWHPLEFSEVLMEIYRTHVPLEERIAIIDNPPAVERSIARQMEVSTPRHVLEKMLFLTLERIEMEHGLELTMQDGGELFIVGREKTPSRLSPALQKEIDMARKLAKDLHAMDKSDGGTIDGQAIKIEQETDDKVSDKLMAQIGRLAKRVLEYPDILTEPVDVEFRTEYE